MRTFLGLLMVVIASGDDEVTINGVLEDSVLLPCSCPNRSLHQEFKWQMDEPNKTLVFMYNGITSDFYGIYKGRAKMFLAENSNNCSVLLTNIKKDDEGKYKCIFHIEDRYCGIFIKLKVSGEKLDPQIADTWKESPRPPKNHSHRSQSACFMTNFKTIPVVMVLGFYLMFI